MSVALAGQHPSQVLPSGLVLYQQLYVLRTAAVGKDRYTCKAHPRHAKHDFTTSWTLEPETFATFNKAASGKKTLTLLERLGQSASMLLTQRMCNTHDLLLVS